MSQTETHVGKVRKMAIGEKEIEEYCFNFCFKNNIHLPKGYDNYAEFIEEEHYKTFKFINNTLYWVIEDKNWGEEDPSTAKINENGDVEYVVQFYNGGASFEEALGYVLEENKL